MLFGAPDLYGKGTVLSVLCGGKSDDSGNNAGLGLKIAWGLDGNCPRTSESLGTQLMGCLHFISNIGQPEGHSSLSFGV